VYIKQTALIVVLAQIGCFVPAKHATVPVRDRILSRLGTSDDMEHNMSTFFTEMKETSYVLSNLTDRSLVIIDELGRGTSTIDGRPFIPYVPTFCK
jgi:DNA mismatch repair ATPase MutS